MRAGLPNKNHAFFFKFVSLKRYYEKDLILAFEPIWKPKIMPYFFFQFFFLKILKNAISKMTKL